MAVQVARLEAVLSADTRHFDRGMNRADRTMHQTSKRIGRGAMLIGAGIAGIGVAGAFAGKKMIALASDAAEVDSKLMVVFGKNLPSVSRQIEKFSEVTGASKFALRDQAASMGALLGPMMGSKQAAAEMSIQTVKLATDLGSFNNIPMEEALEKIRSGLVGQSEPLRSLGVLLSEAAVKAEAYRMGLAKQGAELTEQEKVQARYSLIMQQTTQAQGDATRTSGSMANQMKMLKNSLTDAATEMGMKLIPIALRVVSTFNAHWPEISRIVGVVFGTLGRLMDDLVAVFQRNWPKIKKAAEDVANWYRDNLEPTIKSVARNIAVAWERATQDMTKDSSSMARQQNTILGNLAVSAVGHLNAILAALRGDWRTAWDQAKRGAIGSMIAIQQFVEGFDETVKKAAEAIGRAIMEGIKNGIKASGPIVKDALVDAVSGAFNAASDWLYARSPSKRAADEIGKPISEGVAQGIADSKRKAIDAAVAMVEQAVSAAQARAQTASGTLGSTLGMAFSARQGAVLTPSEKRIAEIENRRAAESLQRSLSDAMAGVTQAIAGGDPAEIATATRAVAEARENILIASLQKQATEERTNLTTRQAFEQQHFQARLEALQNYLNSGEATTAGATKRINTFMKNFGIGIGGMGELLGLSYARGIRKQIPAAVQAAKDLANSVKQRKVIMTKAAAEEALIDAILAKAEKDSGASGDRGPAPKVAGPSGGSTSLQGLVAFANSMGFNPSHNQLTGGLHTAGSLHYSGKAVDMSGSASAMSNAFYAAIQTFGGKIDELFYDPIGWYIDKGQKIKGAIGGHRNHVHLGVYDKGGYLPPGWSIAGNFTGRPEPVGMAGGGGDTIVVQLGTDVLARLVRNAKGKWEQQNGRAF